jgi:hypothetical protein
MRKMLGLIVVLVFHVVALAQTGQASWSNLSVVKPGQNVRVIDSSSKARQGSFKSFSDTSIVLMGKDGEFSIQRLDVRSVKLLKGMGRTAHTLLGAGIGAGAGAGIMAASWESHGFLGGKGAGAAVGAVIGALAGAVVGSVLPVDHPTLYVSASH